MKKSYFKLAKIYHPDSQFKERSAEKFQEVQEAYSVLGNDDSRERYDRDSLEDMGTKYDDEEREDISTAASKIRDRDIDHDATFRKVFGIMKDMEIKSEEKIQPARYSISNHGHQITTHFILPLTLEEAANGCDKQLCIRSVDVCTRCNGNIQNFSYKLMITQFYF